MKGNLKLDPPIYIDNRAGSGVTSVKPGRRMISLTEYPPLNTLAQLYPLASLSLAGDAFFAGNGPRGRVNIGIEVKSLGDLISSITTNRLQAQLASMIECGYDYIYLLYYGRYRASPAPIQGVRSTYYTLEAFKGMEIRASRPKEVWRLMPSYQKDKMGNDRPLVYTFLERALVEVALTGVRVVHLPSKRHVALYIGDVLYPWYNSPWADHTLFQSFNTSGDIPPSTSALLPDIPAQVYERAIVISKMLRNVGWDRSMQAAYHFEGGMGQMLTCYDVSEWKKIRGWGGVLSAKIVGKLREGVMDVGRARVDARRVVDRLDMDMQKLKKEIEEIGEIL